MDPEGMPTPHFSNHVPRVAARDLSLSEGKHFPAPFQSMAWGELGYMGAYAQPKIVKAVAVGRCPPVVPCQSRIRHRERKYAHWPLLPQSLVSAATMKPSWSGQELILLPRQHLTTADRRAAREWEDRGQ